MILKNFKHDHLQRSEFYFQRIQRRNRVIDLIARIIVITAVLALICVVLWQVVNYIDSLPLPLAYLNN